jgi:hypothetical protein
MSLFKKYYKIIIESTTEDRYRKRKGLEILNELSPYEQLEKYKDDPNIYISFTNIKKLGINPKTYFNTPIGIYSYPLHLIWKDFKHLDKKIWVPWALHMPYIHVFKPKDGTNGLFIDKYDENDLKKDIQKIRDSNIFDQDKIDFILNQTDQLIIKTPPDILWFITRALTIKKNLDEIEKIHKGIFNTFASPVRWNKIFKDILGYNYVTDSGEGIIHENEPIQAVFFSVSSIKIIDVIFNRPSINTINKHFIYNKKNKISKNAKFKISVEGDDLSDKLSGELPDEFISDQFYCEWYDGDWYDGTWENGRWWNGRWWNGTWLGGLFLKGIWKDGLWKGGEFGIRNIKINKDAIWEKGTWEYGNWYNSVWKDGTWENGTWWGGIWKNGVWKDGTWRGGYDKYGDYHSEGDSPDKWNI